MIFCRPFFRSNFLKIFLLCGQVARSIVLMLQKYSHLNLGAGNPNIEEEVQNCISEKKQATKVSTVLFCFHLCGPWLLLGAWYLQTDWKKRTQPPLSPCHHHYPRHPTILNTSTPAWILPPFTDLQHRHLVLLNCKCQLCLQMAIQAIKSVEC